ncbi:MAG: leucine-rich repeat protein [Christensenellales bacterium]
MCKTAKTIVLLTMIFVMAISVGLMVTACEIGDDVKPSDEETYYTVLFDSLGGTEVSAISIGDNQMLTPPIPPTKQGYFFVGWYVDTDFSRAWNFAEDKVTANMTLYAKWDCYTITTNANMSNAGTYTIKNQEMVTVGDSVTITATTNLGYTWVGWFDEETKLTDEMTYTFSMPEESKTYTAKWQINEEMSNFNFSSTPNTCTIKGVKDKTIVQAIIPNYVTRITRGAFYDCSSLVSMVIPFVGETKDGSSNTYLGYIFGATSYPFNSSYVPASLKSVTITGGTSIGTGAFYGCRSLTNITLSDSVTSIGEEAFKYCSSLTSITIPDSVMSIGSNAFHNCRSLTSITISESVTSIGEWAFSGCSSLTSITIPNSVTSIGNGAFDACSSLESMTMPDGVTSIGKWAFKGCSSLTSITIPNSVTSIGNETFSGCSSLTSITIPDNVTSIGNDTFYGCSSLTSITIPNSVMTIGDEAFYGSSSLTSINFRGTKAQWSAITKGTIWNYDTGSYTIYCTDGNISK